MSRTIGRRAYAEMFGPTVGDRVRLADTGLIIEVEQDHTLKAGGYGEEVKFGGGKTIRDGMGQSQVVNGPGHHEAHDVVKMCIRDRLLYRPSTPPMALKTSSSISISAIRVLNTIHTTRPGWLCVTRAKKLLQARLPA